MRLKLRKELWFGFALMALLVAGSLYMLLSAPVITRGHLGLLMLSLVVVAIMLGFPTAFTLMGMGMLFTWLAYDRDWHRTLDLMVQAAYKVMANDVLISIPLFVFMGYIVERANLIEKLFKSLHLSLARVPGALAVATLVTCAVFATATGIVGAVVTLMGLLAFPAMLRAGYSISLSAGSVTAGGCLGILIPPSVLLIVYGATAGVSVVQLYAGAFFPGLMLAGLYVLYVIVLAKLKPSLAPPLSAEDRRVPLPAPLAQAGATGRARRAGDARRRAEGPAQPRRAGVVPAEAVVRRAVAAVRLRGLRIAQLPHRHEPRGGRRLRGPAADGRRRAVGPEPRQRARRAAGTTERGRVAGAAGRRRRAGAAGQWRRLRAAGEQRRLRAAAAGGVSEPPGGAASTPATTPAAAGSASAAARRRRRRRVTAGGAGGLLDRPRGRRGGAAVVLRGAQRHALRSVQDAARVVLPARRS